jgi:hypothetical protein
VGLGKTLEAVWLHSSALINPNVIDAGPAQGEALQMSGHQSSLTRIAELRSAPAARKVGGKMRDFCLLSTYAAIRGMFVRLRIRTRVNTMRIDNRFLMHYTVTNILERKTRCQRRLKSKH